MVFVNDVLTDVSDPLGLKHEKFSRYRETRLFLKKETNSKTLVNSVNYGVKKGYLEKRKNHHRPEIRLSALGRDKILGHFPLINFQNRGWDKVFRFVLFDVRELNRYKRDRLRQKLKRLGFALYQKSVYVSPNPLEDILAEFLGEYKMEDHVSVITGKIDHRELKSLALRLWPLKEINDRYRQIFKLYSQGKKFEAYRHCFEVLQSEPFLPPELLPDNWLGQKVWEKLRAK